MIHKNLINNKEMSSIGFGTWGLSGDWQKERVIPERNFVHGLFALARDNGISFFDTAPVYGAGIMETYLGELPWRNDIIVATKVPAKIKPEIKNNTEPYQSYYDEDHIRKWVNKSIRRLQRDKIDLLQLHNWSSDWNENADFFLQPLVKLKEEGSIERIGISLPDNFCHDIDQVLELGIIDFIQVPYNPTQQWAKEKLFSQCKAKGVHILIRSPFVHGLITTNLKNDSKDYKRDKRQGKIENQSSLIRQIENWLVVYGNTWETINQDILRNIHSQVGENGTILIGMTKSKHIIENTKILNLTT